MLDFSCFFERLDVNGRGVDETLETHYFLHLTPPCTQWCTTHHTPLTSSFSCLYLRNRLPLTSAMSITPSYLQNPSSLATTTDYRDWQIPLGRRFRALKIWFVIRTYGVEAMQKMIRRHVALGELFAGLVEKECGKGGKADGVLEIVSGPAFALTVVRCLVPGKSNGLANEALTNGHASGASTDNEEVRAKKEADAEMNDFNAKQASVKVEAENALTKKVIERINERGELFLTPAVADGVYVIRVVSANELADEAHVRRAFEVLVETAKEFVDEA
jgi:aromatic-L-amino-acid decarboxylase